MKRLLRFIGRLNSGFWDAEARFIFGLEAIALGFKAGNVYSPSWAPETRERITDVTYPYIAYTVYRPAVERPGQWIECGSGKQPSLWGFWIEHTFTQYAPLGATGLVLR
jgi:hypothetical protein